jgi:transposase
LSKASQAELADALTGRFSDHHGFMAKVHLDLIDGYAGLPILPHGSRGTSNPTGQRLRKVPALLRARKLSVTIPEISLIGAEQILAEIGTDMTVFTSPVGWPPGLGWPQVPTSWPARSHRPGAYPVTPNLKGTLGIGAMTAARQKKSFLSARYRRIRARRGHSRALVALARTILELAGICDD